MADTQIEVKVSIGNFNMLKFERASITIRYLISLVCLAIYIIVTRYYNLCIVDNYRPLMNRDTAISTLKINFEIKD